ncbi:MAG: carboxypeptidase regulatory-like domain-containing protein, partial [Bryobacteraceae bacterium]
MRNLPRLIILGTLLGNLLWLPSAIAQSSSGTITGTAKDSAGSALQSALVKLDPLARQAVTDSQGEFRMTDVPPGDYTVTVSYVGFAQFTKTVKVEGGEVASIDAVLQVASRKDEVLVTAERAQGEAEAVNIERTADNIVQILPSKVITSLPNTNIADAVGRLPSVTLERDEGEGKYVQIRGTEPRLSNVTINGVHVPSPEASVRNIKLDVIPSDLVDRIEVNKTLSANQDADAIGGSVNLVTRTPGEKPVYSFAAQGGYTPIQEGRTLDAFSGTVGQRFFKDKKLGISLGGSFDHNNRGIDDLEPTQAIGNLNGRNFAFINSEDLRTYKYDRSRYGFAGGADYSLTPGTSIYVRGLFSDFHDYGSTYVYTPNAGAIVSNSGALTTFDNTGNMQYREYIRRPDQQVFSFATGATHAISTTVINYQLAVSRGHNFGGQDFATTYFNGPSNVPFGLDESDPYRPKLSPLDSTQIYNPAAYSIASTGIPNYRSTELDFEGWVNLARSYSIGSHPSTFEMGFEARDAHKTQNENDQFY